MDFQLKQSGVLWKGLQLLWEKGHSAKPWRFNIRVRCRPTKYLLFCVQPKLLPAHFTHTKSASTFTFEMDRRKYPCEISTWTVNTQVHHTSTDRILCIDLYDLYAEKETKWPNIQMVNLVTTCALRSWCLFEAEPALRLQSQTLVHSSYT